MGCDLVGANLTKVNMFFLTHGGTIQHVRGTGEVRYTHPRFPHPIVINCRRKDAPRYLTMHVMRIAQ